MDSLAENLSKNEKWAPTTEEWKSEEFNSIFENIPKDAMKRGYSILKVLIFINLL